MPLYIYSNSDGQTIEKFYHMNDSKPQEFTDDQGVKWSRDWGAARVQGAIDSKIDPFSSQQFVNKTSRPDTVGKLWERSKELSEMRKAKNGFDPLSQKAKEDYSKARNGKPLVDFKKLANAEVTVDLASKKVEIK